MNSTSRHFSLTNDVVMSCDAVQVLEEQPIKLSPKKPKPPRILRLQGVESSARTYKFDWNGVQTSVVETYSNFRQVSACTQFVFAVLSRQFMQRYQLPLKYPELPLVYFSVKHADGGIHKEAVPMELVRAQLPASSASCSSKR